MIRTFESRHFTAANERPTRRALPKRQTTLATAAIALALLAQQAAGAVMVSSSPAPPSTDILASRSLDFDSFAWPAQWVGGGSIDRLEVAQSFRVASLQDWNVDKVTMRARSFGASVLGHPFHFDIWSVSDADDISGNTLIRGQSAVLPASGLASGFWTFDIENVQLTSGHHYAFVLGFDTGPDPGRYINFVNDYNSTDTYTDGRMFFRGGTPLQWSFPALSSNRDFEFYLQGHVVPEPSTFALAAIGGTVLLAGLRRSQKRKLMARSATIASG